MTNRLKMIAAAAGLVAFAGCVEDTGSSAPGTPSVGSSTDLSSFEGARAGQAEMGIQNLGYQLVRSQGLTSYWANFDTGTCFAITTSDGRYSDVTQVPMQDC
jgi:hypothetical protein